MTIVRLTVDLDIPNVEDYSEGELAELLFDTYVNYNTLAHFRDSMRWLAKAKPGTANESPASYTIYQHHQTWGEICSNVDWSFKILEKK